MTPCVTGIITSLHSRVWTSMHTLSERANPGVLLNKHERWRHSTATLHALFQLFPPAAGRLRLSPCLKMFSGFTFEFIELELLTAPFCYPVFSRLGITVKSEFLCGYLMPLISWYLGIFPLINGLRHLSFSLCQAFSINHHRWLLWTLPAWRADTSTAVMVWWWLWHASIRCNIISFTPTWYLLFVHLKNSRLNCRSRNSCSADG